jgi:hypothetical protein
MSMARTLLARSTANVMIHQGRKSSWWTMTIVLTLERIV